MKHVDNLILVLAAAIVALLVVLLVVLHRDREVTPPAPLPPPECEDPWTDLHGVKWELAYTVQQLDEATGRVTSLTCVYRPVRYGDAKRQRRLRADT